MVKNLRPRRLFFSLRSYMLQEGLGIRLLCHTCLGLLECHQAFSLEGGEWGETSLVDICTLTQDILSQGSSQFTASLLQCARKVATQLRKIQDSGSQTALGLVQQLLCEKETGPCSSVLTTVILTRLPRLTHFHCPK